jgi:hypothetical protein
MHCLDFVEIFIIKLPMVPILSQIIVFRVHRGVVAVKGGYVLELLYGGCTDLKHALSVITLFNHWDVTGQSRFWGFCIYFAILNH